MRDDMGWQAPTLQAAVRRAPGLASRSAWPMLARWALSAMLMAGSTANAVSMIVERPCEQRHPCDALSGASEPERFACAIKHATSIIEATAMSSGNIATLEDAIPLRGMPPLLRDNRGLFKTGGVGSHRCLPVDRALGPRVRVYMNAEGWPIYVGRPAEPPTPSLSNEGRALPGPEAKGLADALHRLLNGGFPQRETVARALKAELSLSSRSDGVSVFAGSTAGPFAGWRVSYAEEWREQGPARDFVVAMTTARGQELPTCLSTEDVAGKLLPPTWRHESARIREEYVRETGDFEAVIAVNPVALKESPMCVDFLQIAFRRK